MESIERMTEFGKAKLPELPGTVVYPSILNPARGRPIIKDDLPGESLYVDPSSVNTNPRAAFQPTPGLPGKQILPYSQPALSLRERAEIMHAREMKKLFKEADEAFKKRTEIYRKAKAQNEATRKRKAKEASDPYKNRTSLENLAVNYMKVLDDLKYKRDKWQGRYEEAKARKSIAGANQYKNEVERLDREIKRVQKKYDDVMFKMLKDRGERLGKAFERMGEGAQFVSWSTRMTATPMPNQVSRKFINGGYFLA